MKAFLRRTYLVGAYYASWFAFGAVGLLLNVGCVPFLLLPRRRGREQRTRRIIRALFELWCGWFHATGVLHIRWRGFDGPLPERAVWVANHPTLLDATFLLSRLPDGFCIFKPALMRNPAIAPAAILAGYETGNQGVETIRGAAAKIEAGGSLLVFPEGTRTGVGQRLGEFRPGFALIAARAGVGVQTVLIRSSVGLVRRGRAWWRPPPVLPAWIELERSTFYPAETNRAPAKWAAAIEQQIAAQLPEEVG